MPNENHFTEAVIPPDNGYSNPFAGGRVVVGVMSFKLEPAHFGRATGS